MYILYTDEMYIVWKESGTGLLEKQPTCIKKVTGKVKIKTFLASWFFE